MKETNSQIIRSVYAREDFGDADVFPMNESFQESRKYLMDTEFQRKREYITFSEDEKRRIKDQSASVGYYGGILGAKCLMDNFLEIQEGMFTMGDDKHGIAHPVSILACHVDIGTSFYIGKTPVTQKQWKAVMGSLPNIREDSLGDNKPVVEVSWFDAIRYTENLSRIISEWFGGEITVSLPTEAEWEYVAKCEGTSILCDSEKQSHGWFLENSSNRLHEVATRSPMAIETNYINSDPGIRGNVYDMLGNVWEWCLDWYSPKYTNEHVVSPVGPLQEHSNKCKVQRGGSFDSETKYISESKRSYNIPTIGQSNVGFRVKIVAKSNIIKKLID